LGVEAVQAPVGSRLDAPIKALIVERKISPENLRGFTFSGPQPQQEKPFMQRLCC
jgi:hypothetical protein